MTFSLSIGGVTLPSEAILLENGIGSLTTNADGQLGSSTIVVDDPQGSYDFAYLQQVVAEESACALSRLYTGYLYGIVTSRGPYKSGAGRIHTLTIGDLNFLLHLQPLYGASAKRPRESGDDRLAYLMGVPGMDGIVFDNGLIVSNTAMFGEEDLRNQYPNEVLESICTAGIGSRIFYLTWDESAAAGEEVTLFYAEPDSVLMASSLAVSNVLGNFDEVTTFEPYLDSELDAQGEEIYCGLWLTYGGRGDRLFTHNATTHATYFGSSSPPGLHRIGTLTLDRVGELDTAQHHSDVWLNLHSGALKTLTYTLRLPRDQVNLVNAGMLIPNELIHLMGFETPETWRITERTVVFTNGTNEYYDLALKLSVTGGKIIGGGGGGLPHQGGPCLINSYAANTAPMRVLSWSGQFTPTAGSVLIVIAATRAGQGNIGSTTTPGWTTLPNADQGGPSTSTAVAYQKVSDGTETSLDTGAVSGTSGEWIVLEVAGDAGSTVTSYETSVSYAELYAHVAITPPSGSALVFAMLNSENEAAMYYRPDGGWAKLWQTVDNGAPSTAVLYRQVANASGSYVAGAFIEYPQGIPNGADHWWGFGLAISTPGCGIDNPPERGQWVYGEVVTMTGAAGTTKFPYGLGSLVVRVDAVIITRASYTETDPSTGDFTLSWTPDPDEVVAVDYQGS